MLSGQSVEGRHVNDISRISPKAVRVSISRGGRRIVVSMCVGEIAH